MPDTNTTSNNSSTGAQQPSQSAERTADERITAVSGASVVAALRTNPDWKERLRSTAGPASGPTHDQLYSGRWNDHTGHVARRAQKFLKEMSGRHKGEIITAAEQHAKDGKPITERTIVYYR